MTNLASSMYQSAQTNLQSTYENIDELKLTLLAQTLKKANSVTFLGDYHALASFYLVQLDLMAHKIPCYSFYNPEYTHDNFKHLGVDDIIVYFSVTENFNNPMICGP